MPQPGYLFLGLEAMVKLIKMKVLIVGMKGQNIDSVTSTYYAPTHNYPC